MATVLETIQSDRDTFLNTDENPAARSAVYTPPGGVAQPAITVLFMNVPIHGDENQVLPVDEAVTTVLAKSSDVDGYVLRGTLVITGTTYQLIGSPYPDENDNMWSVLDLRLLVGQETPI